MLSDSIGTSTPKIDETVRRHAGNSGKTIFLLSPISYCKKTIRCIVKVAKVVESRLRDGRQIEQVQA